jgi:hypothetical protein
VLDVLGHGFGGAAGDPHLDDLMLAHPATSPARGARIRGPTVLMGELPSSLTKPPPLLP